VVNFSYSHESADADGAASSATATAADRARRSAAAMDAALLLGWLMPGLGWRGR